MHILNWTTFWQKYPLPRKAFKAASVGEPKKKKKNRTSSASSNTFAFLDISVNLRFDFTFKNLR